MREFFLNYVNGLPISDNYKSFILDDGFYNKNPEYYLYYPKLFIIKDVLELNKTDLNNLCFAGYLYYQSTIYTDRIIDDKDVSKVGIVSILQEESIKLLSSLFKLDSDFWKTWNMRRNEYIEAIFLEKKLLNTNDIPVDDYYKLADFKSAFGKIAIDSLFIKSGNNNNILYQKLLESHKYFSIGFQLYDDLLDFKEDYQKNQFNWVYYLLKKSLSEEETKLPIDTKHKLLYIRGIAKNILSESISNFNKAYTIIEELNAQCEWLNIISDLQNKIHEFHNITKGYLLVLEKKIELNDAERTDDYFFDFQNVESLHIKKGINFIYIDFLKNYAELKHIMFLGKNEGFKNEEEIHVSDVFQRALLNDCLFYITKVNNIDAKYFFDKEIEYLLNLERQNNIGGWSYFPYVDEIAPDIDDLGQILQLFYNTKNNELIKDYSDLINIALKRQSENGGIETWIIPKDYLNGTHKRQTFFNETKWGVGPDLEVAANFGYSLVLIDDNGIYSKNIIKLINYICENQSSEGFWKSRWYYGNYYGTYVCLRLLILYKDTHIKTIIKSQNYLIKNQNSDGGWGKNKSTPLDTAFALLSLKLLKDNSNINSIKNATDFLISSQNKDGSWDATSFIKPKSYEPYSSIVLTTAFVLKALSYDYS